MMDTLTHVVQCPNNNNNNQQNLKKGDLVVVDGHHHLVESQQSSISLLTLKRTESFARKLQLKLKNLNNSSGEAAENCLESTSDAHFDFDIASPPEESSGGGGDDPTLVTTTCSTTLLNEMSPTGTVESSAMESGCVLSSRTLSPVESPTNEESEFFATNISEAGSSDASDSSVYYDVPEEFEEDLLLATPLVNNNDSSTTSNGVAAPAAVVVPPKIVEPEVEVSSVVLEEEEDEFVVHRIQRSSSLKTGKTPPGTPGRKKIVRFADVLGLDLADVRTFLDEIPNVPTSAFKDLKDAMDNLSLGGGSVSSSVFGGRPNNTVRTKTLLPSFHQPVAMPDFFDRIRDQKVLLENAYVAEGGLCIKGTVRVKNMDFHKSVYVRFSYDDWNSFQDFQATYDSGSCDGFSDRFSFTLYVDDGRLSVGSRLSFACRFHCLGQQFWDNNSGRNYTFHCVPSSSQQNLNLAYHLGSSPPSIGIGGDMMMLSSSSSSGGSSFSGTGWMMQ